MTNYFAIAIFVMMKCDQFFIRLRFISMAFWSIDWIAKRKQILKWKAHLKAIILQVQFL